MTEDCLHWLRRTFILEELIFNPLLAEHSARLFISLLMASDANINYWSLDFYFVIDLLLFTS